MSKIKYLLRIAHNSQDELLLRKRFQVKNAKWISKTPEKLIMSPKLMKHLKKYDVLRKLPNLESSPRFDNYIREYATVVDLIQEELFPTYVLGQEPYDMGHSSSADYYTYGYTIENINKNEILIEQKKLIENLAEHGYKLIYKKKYKKATNTYHLYFVFRGPLTDDKYGHIRFSNWLDFLTGRTKRIAEVVTYESQHNKNRI